MACLYKRRKQYWISYYIEGKQIQKTLHTSNERVALAKKKQIEYQLSLGQLHAASQLRVPEILEAFCKHITATRTYKSYKNDISRLRSFFGPVCESLKPTAFIPTDPPALNTSSFVDPNLSHNTIYRNFLGLIQAKKKAWFHAK